MVTKVSLHLFTEQLLDTLSSGLTFIIQETAVCSFVFFCSMNLLSVSNNNHICIHVSDPHYTSTEYRHSMTKYHNILVDQDGETLLL